MMDKMTELKKEIRNWKKYWSKWIAEFDKTLKVLLLERDHDLPDWYHWKTEIDHNGWLHISRDTASGWEKFITLSPTCDEIPFDVADKMAWEQGLLDSFDFCGDHEIKDGCDCSACEGRREIEAELQEQPQICEP